MENKVKYLFIFLVLNIMFQCTEKEKKFLIEVHWSKRGMLKSHDKFNLIIDYKRNSDSVYFYHNMKNEKLDFRFIINKEEVNYCASSDTVRLTQLGVKKITAFNKEYIIHNLLNYSPNQNDGAVNFFITKEFGIINILNSSNMKIGIIEFSEKKIQEIVKSLNSQLMTDTNFYFYNNNLPPR